MVIGAGGQNWKSATFWLVGTVAGWALGFVPAMLYITGAFCCGTDGGGDVGTGRISALACLGIFLNGAFFFGSGIIVSVGEANAIGDALGKEKEKWLWATSIGAVVGWTLGWIGTIPSFSAGSGARIETWVISSAIIGAILGLFIGLAQLTILKRAHLGRLWWIAASILGWTCGSVTYWLVYNAAGGPFEPTYTNYEGTLWAKSASAPGALPAMLLGWLVGGLALAIITGSAMILLLKNRQSVTEV